MPNLSIPSSSHSAMTLSSLWKSCDSPSVTITMTFFASGRAPRSGRKASFLIVRKTNRCKELVKGQILRQWKTQTWGGRIPGCFNGEKSVGLCAGVLRKGFDIIHHYCIAVKLAQVDEVTHIFSVRHYAHLEEKHLSLVYFSFHFFRVLPSLPPPAFPDRLRRMWRVQPGLIWPWKMWLQATPLCGQKTFQCCPVENHVQPPPAQRSQNKSFIPRVIQENVTQFGNL